MCIVFFYINPHATKSEYKLIIIFNREESYNRKTSPAHIWEEDSSIIGGRDLKSLSRGTWFAASRKGKIGILLNIHVEMTPQASALGRGVLVSSFLKGDLNAQEFGKKLCREKFHYDGFHLLLFELNANGVGAYIQTNYRGKLSEMKELGEGYHGFGNSAETPYKKVNWGKRRFEEIINQYNSTDKRDTLVGELLKLLKSEKRHYPDEELFVTKKLIHDEQFIEKHSSIFVRIPEKKHGTRTHSIIMVTHDDKIDFNEYTLKEPINMENLEWIQFQFFDKLASN